MVALDNYARVKTQSGRIRNTEYVRWCFRKAAILAKHDNGCHPNDLSIEKYFEEHLFLSAEARRTFKRQ